MDKMKCKGKQRTWWNAHDKQPLSTLEKLWEATIKPSCQGKRYCPLLVYTFSKEEAKILDLPKAKRNASPINGNLSLAFMSISLITATSFTDTTSWVGPNHSLTIGPYFSCNSAKHPTKRSKKWNSIRWIKCEIWQLYIHLVLRVELQLGLNFLGTA